MNPDAGVFVTDTHPLAYYSGRRFSKLSKRARRLYDGAEDGRVLICVPSIVLAELLWTDVNEMHMLPFKDPFDRMIVVHAQRNGLSVVGVDTSFDLYGVPRLW